MTVRLVLIGTLGILGVSSSYAAQRAFVASDGVDNLTCSITAPCRAFLAAMTAVNVDGEIIVLDSAGYGPVTVTKAVSIIAPAGVYAGISVAAGLDGITVSAGVADKVVLRGLTINGQGGNNGILVTSGKETYIEDCVVANLTQHGIHIEGGAAVHIARTTVRSNGANGVRVEPLAATTITTTLTDSLVTGNVNSGYFVSANSVAGSTVRAAVLRGASSHNGASGYRALGLLGTVSLVVSKSVAVENGINGITANGANATVMAVNNSLLRNVGADMSQGGGAELRTSEDNALTGRGAADVIGTLTANPNQ